MNAIIMMAEGKWEAATWMDDNWKVVEASMQPLQQNCWKRQQNDTYM
jgi:hypothetical protein